MRWKWAGVGLILSIAASGWIWRGVDREVPEALAHTAPGVARADADSAISARLILAGDGGTKPGFRRPRTLVLKALHDTVSNLRDRTTVVFLGDNVYDQGMDSANVAATAPRLHPQLAAVAGREAGRMSGLFVPGNHDWSGRLEGQRIRAQARYIDSVTAGSASLFPAPAGCPGPDAHAVTGSSGDTVLVLVALDTNWLLKGGAVRGPTPACAATTPEDVIDALRALLSTLRHPVVVVAHHPIWSVGKHAKELDSTQPQDLFSTQNTYMRTRLASAMRGAPPLIWAGGHDHSLQVFENDDLPADLKESVNNAVVSGALSKRTAVVESRPGRSFSSRGFIIVDFQTSGAVELRVVGVHNENEVRLFEAVIRKPVDTVVYQR